MLQYKLRMRQDNWPISVAETEEKRPVCAVVLIVHGMAEYKGRYYPFMEKLSGEGFHAVAYDHRGHGGSVTTPEMYGYFGGNGATDLVEDLYNCVLYFKEKYSGCPLFLFAHSMGTIITRKFMKVYDDQVDGVILSGIPTENPFAAQGLRLAQLITRMKGPYFRSKKLNRLVLGLFNQGYEIPNSWLSRDKEVVQRFNQDSRCGFVFTANGCETLFTMLLDIFEVKGWQVKNPQLPILIMAGTADPVIQNTEMFHKAVRFIKYRGYTQVESKLYPEMRHELLQEIENDAVDQDVLHWLRSKSNNFIKKN